MGWYGYGGQGRGKGTVGVCRVPAQAGRLLSHPLFFFITVICWALFSTLAVVTLGNKRWIYIHLRVPNAKYTISSLCFVLYSFGFDISTLSSTLPQQQ